MIAIRLTICCCSVLASGEPTPSTSLIPNSVDGSVPARVIIDVRSSGSGSSAPRVDQHLLHHHLAAGADRPAQALRLGADLLVVDAHRAVDRVLGGQQDRRVVRDPVPQTEAVRRDLVQQRLTAVEHRRSHPR